MCGIIAYTGARDAEPILVEGLRRLEYRGYDSAGIATVAGGDIHLRKRSGRVAGLAELLGHHPAPGRHGIGHTRWATHGGAGDANAHPHLGGDGAVAVVHNGVLENYRELGRRLRAGGAVFRSETDSEAIAHLIASYLRDDLAAAVRQALPHLRGTYALAALSPRDPGRLVGARLGSPLVLGLGRGETFLASDANALRGYADRVIHLEDGQVCAVTAGAWEIIDPASRPVRARVEPLDGTPEVLAKGDFPHYMLKEIHEQPEAVAEALRGRLDALRSTARLGPLPPGRRAWARAGRLVLTGCGSSYHAALVGEYLLEELARVPVEVEYASEFRYREAPLGASDLVIALTQSGETADTLAAVAECRRRGRPALALCNAAGSSIARVADGVLPLRAGPEVGVASTKAFSAQLAVLALLALYLGRLRHLSGREGARVVRDLRALPAALREALGCEALVRRVAAKYAGARAFLYLGRQSLYPVALEGALKLQEVSYTPAQGYPAGELKHGPLALADGDTPALFLALRGPVFPKVMNNLEEARARGAPVIAVASAGDAEVAARADDVLPVPEVPEYLQPFVAVVPLQLLAYHVALLRGRDVDRPRNLAKSVTVE
jgi:glucosamine--fructose-6-phosphate aminotransferase (isomerizing)